MPRSVKRFGWLSLAKPRSLVLIGSVVCGIRSMGCVAIIGIVIPGCGLCTLQRRPCPRPARLWPRVEVAMGEIEAAAERGKKFVDAVAEMRKYQKLYFKNRLQGDLHIAKQWESVVDKILEIGRAH